MDVQLYRGAKPASNSHAIFLIVTFCLFIYLHMYKFIVCICIYKCTYIYIELYAKYYNNKRKKNVDQVVVKMKKQHLKII